MTVFVLFTTFFEFSDADGTKSHQKCQKSKIEVGFDDFERTERLEGEANTEQVRLAADRTPVGLL